VPLVLPGIAGATMALLLSGIVLYILLRTLDQWCRPLINGLTHGHSSLWKKILLSPVRYVLGPAARFALHYTRVALGWAVHACVRPAVRWLHELAILVGELAAWLEHFPADVHWALHYLRHVAVPRLIHAALLPVIKLANEAHKLAAALRKEADQAGAAIGATLTGIGWLTGATFFGSLRNLAAAFAHLWRYVYGELTSDLRVAERAIRTLRADAATLERYVHGSLLGLIHRLTAVVDDVIDTVYVDLKPFADALRRGVIPGLMLTGILEGLRRLLPGIFCRNTNEVGKVLCGLDSGLLDVFLLGVTAELALGGLPELVRELQAVTRESVEAIQALAEV
jgi:hypothetical protein